MQDGGKILEMLVKLMLSYYLFYFFRNGGEQVQDGGEGEHDLLTEILQRLDGVAPLSPDISPVRPRLWPIHVTYHV